jgi:hypothetical protein
MLGSYHLWFVYENQYYEFGVVELQIPKIGLLTKTNQLVSLRILRRLNFVATMFDLRRLAVRTDCRNIVCLQNGAACPMDSDLRAILFVVFT